MSWRDNKHKFFAYVQCNISKTKSKTAEKIQDDVFLFNWKRHAKFQALFQKKENTWDRHLAWFSTQPFILCLYSNKVKLDSLCDRLSKWTERENKMQEPWSFKNLKT